MNPDESDLELKLRALLHQTPSHDPTLDWRQSILRRARPVSLLPPRWLVMGWAAAWIVAMFLEMAQLRTEHPQISAKTPLSPPATTLLTYHIQLHQELELP